MASQPGLFQESVHVTAYSRASVRSSAARNSQGNLSPVEVHLSNPDSSSLVDANPVNKDHGASDCLTDVHLAPGTVAKLGRQETLFVFSEGFPQLPHQQAPMVPCSSPFPDLFATMESCSIPLSSPPPVLSRSSFNQTISPMYEALSLPSQSSSSRVADISEWILARPYSRAPVISRRSSSPQTKSPRRPERPPALDDIVLHDILMQWIEVEGNKGRCKSEGEEGCSAKFPVARNERYGSIPLRSTSPTVIRENEPGNLLQNEASEIIASAPILRCTVVTDAISTETDPFAGEERSTLPVEPRDMDFFDIWTTSPLRTPSPSSSLDHSFHLDLFSPASKDRLSSSLSAWNSIHVSPVETSNSPGFYSSSPFVGWSSVSPLNTKLPNLHSSIPRVSFDTIALHQPQPVRPIPPIPLPSLFHGSSPEPDDTSYHWTKDAINARFARGPLVELSPPDSPAGKQI